MAVGVDIVALNIDNKICSKHHVLSRDTKLRSVALAFVLFLEPPVDRCNETRIDHKT